MWINATSRVNAEPHDDNARKVEDYRVSSDRQPTDWVHREKLGRVANADVLPVEVATPLPTVVLSRKLSYLCVSSKKFVFSFFLFADSPSLRCFDIETFQVFPTYPQC